MHNVTLQLLQNIWNFINFCKLGTSYPSGISGHELFNAMTNIEPYCKERLHLQLKLENIL